jgi:hypothetical protein
MLYALACFNQRRDGASCVFYTKGEPVIRTLFVSVLAMREKGKERALLTNAFALFMSTM